MLETHGFDGIKLRGNYMSNPMIDILNHPLINHDSKNQYTSRDENKAREGPKMGKTMKSYPSHSVSCLLSYLVLYLSFIIFPFELRVVSVSAPSYNPSRKEEREKRKKKKGFG